MIRKKVAVAPAKEFQSRQVLFRVLSELYPVDFGAWDPEMCSAIDGQILWGSSDEVIDHSRISAPRCLVLSAGCGQQIPVKKGTVQFEKCAMLDLCFRGQTMTEHSITGFPSLKLRAGDEVVCSLDSRPYWAVRQQSGSILFMAGLGLPDFEPGDTIYSHFNRIRWLELLPLLHFLKFLTRDVDWTMPPLRACIVIDDPNLHGSSYGYIDFRSLIQHAERHNYHVGLATMPIDSWYAKASTSELIRQNKARLSLLIHGNNHLSNELGVLKSDQDAVEVLAQALRRISKLEHETGLDVSRVMAPPHGAMRDNVFAALVRLGYEAGCVSRSSISSWNRHRAWPASFGHPIAELTEEGLPIIPRHVMAQGQSDSYRLAAFLHQPIIPHGHHEDCRNNYEILGEVSKVVNAFGSVEWKDLKSIARSNYLTRKSDNRLIVRMLSRMIQFYVDESVSEIVVERPWIPAEAMNHELIGRSGDVTITSQRCGATSSPIRWSRSGMVEFLSPPPSPLDFRGIPSPPFEIWPLCRRILSELRDRLIPAVRGSR